MRKILLVVMVILLVFIMNIDVFLGFIVDPIFKNVLELVCLCIILLLIISLGKGKGKNYKSKPIKQPFHFKTRAKAIEKMVHASFEEKQPNGEVKTITYYNLKFEYVDRFSSTKDTQVVKTICTSIPCNEEEANAFLESGKLDEYVEIDVYGDYCNVSSKDLRQSIDDTELPNAVASSEYVDDYIIPENQATSTYTTSMAKFNLALNIVFTVICLSLVLMVFSMMALDMYEKRMYIALCVTIAVTIIAVIVGLRVILKAYHKYQTTLHGQDEIALIKSYYEEYSFWYRTSRYPDTIVEYVYRTASGDEVIGKDSIDDDTIQQLIPKMKYVPIKVYKNHAIINTDRIRKHY